MAESLRAAAAGGAERLRDWAFDLGTLAIMEGEVPDGVFQEVLAQLDVLGPRSQEGAHVLLDAMRTEWRVLSEEQRDRLLAAVERGYPRLGEWRACFAASVLLGEQYADARALGALLRLRRCSPEMPRSFVPHGLEHLASESSDAAVRERSLAELLQMQSDESERVTGEVEESLARLMAIEVPLPPDVEARLRTRYTFPDGR